MENVSDTVDDRPLARWLDFLGYTSGRFIGLDQFNRITDQRWQNNIAVTPTDIDRYAYGYDYNSNRLYKGNVVGATNVTNGLDELYNYDRVAGRSAD